MMMGENQEEKKMKKGFLVSEIAEILEESIDKIEEIVKGLQSEFSLFVIIKKTVTKGGT